MKHLLGHLLKGILIVLPLGILGYFSLLIFNAFTGIFEPLVLKYFPFISLAAQRTISFFLLILLLVIIGYLADFLHPIVYIKKLFLKIPLVRVILGAQKNQELPTIFQGKSVVLVSLGNVSVFGVLVGETETILDDQPVKQYKVFVPTAPIVVSGFVVLVPAKDIRKVINISPAQLFALVSTFGTRMNSQILLSSLSTRSQEAPS